MQFNSNLYVTSDWYIFICQWNRFVWMIPFLVGWLCLSSRRNTEYQRTVCNVHKNTTSIFRGDHRQKQPENFRLKHNGLFSSFLFATVQVAFIALEGNYAWRTPKRVCGGGQNQCSYIIISRSSIRSLVGETGKERVSIGTQFFVAVGGLPVDLIAY